MELLKKAKSALNFQDRYSDMEGSEGGFSGKERRALKQAKKSGFGLSKTQKDRSEYLNTVGDERIRGIGTGVATVGGVVAGAYTGNPALITSSLSMGANYLGGEMAEDAAGNDGVGQQLGVQDAMSMATPFLSTMGQGKKKEEGGGGDGTMKGAVASDEGPLAGGGTIGGAVFKEGTKTEGGGVGDLLGSLMGVKLKQGGKLRYNPRKYDYIKGNTFGYD